MAEKSKMHTTFTHFPKSRDCDVCLRTKITRAPCRRRTGEVSIPRAEKFGDLITADHKVLNEECKLSWFKILPLDGSSPIRVKNKKTSQETEQSSRKFLEPSEKPKVIYTKNSLDFCIIL